jgi:cyclase
MKLLTGLVLLFALGLAVFGAPASAQDLGPSFKKVSEGIYVYAGKVGDSNCTIILTQDGVVMVDSGNNPTDSQAVMKAIKQLTTQPIRLLIDSETHADHTTGHYVFSPPATIVAPAGAGAGMRAAYDPGRMEKLAAESPEMRAAAQGYKMVVPHVEFRDRATLNVGERSFELFYMKNVHSDADTAIWLPKERVLFTAASVGVKRFNNLRPTVSIPDTLAAIKMMKALDPQIVIPGHGSPGTVKILDDMERYYDQLLERVKQMVQQGRTLDQIKAELKMPETDSWDGKDRYPNNIEAAYRAVKGS